MVVKRFMNMMIGSSFSNDTNNIIPIISISGSVPGCSPTPGNVFVPRMHCLTTCLILFTNFPKGKIFNFEVSRL